MTTRYPQYFSHHRFLAFAIATCAIIVTLGCSLFSVEYWVHRLDDEKSDQPAESLPPTASDISGVETGHSFESKCLNSPGDSPCPIESCVVFKGEYVAKNVITDELFGKANPSDYACCADFQFTNNSGVDLMGFEHQVTEYGDSWLFQLYPLSNSNAQGSCDNHFTRKDGQETASKGVTEIVVLYANPHCDWIQWDEPGLAKYREPVAEGCFANQ